GNLHPVASDRRRDLDRGAHHSRLHGDGGYSWGFPRHGPGLGQAVVGRFPPCQMVSPGTSRLTMWELRDARARLLPDRDPATREILLFYSGLAEWQGVVSGQSSTLAELEQ